MNVVRNSGLEFDEKRSPAGSVNDEKLDNNISRARSKIFELAYCNPWQWFFTGTIDSSKYDRTDLEKYHKDLTQWLRDYSKRKLYGRKIAYLLIPELHSDGKSWHVHGLLQGLPDSHLHQFVVGDKMGKALAEKVKNGDLVYNWLPYGKKFGFCDLEPIRSHEAVCKYITKYCTQDLAKSVQEVGAHLYYRSKGLQESVLIKKGTTAATMVPTFENEYCAVSWTRLPSDLVQYYVDSLAFYD